MKDQLKELQEKFEATQTKANQLSKSIKLVKLMMKNNDNQDLPVIIAEAEVEMKIVCREIEYVKELIRNYPVQTI